MRRAVAILAFLLVFSGIYAVGRRYTLELVHHVVLHAFLQKAPQDFPEEVALTAFAAAYTAQKLSSTSRERYLKALFAVSQKLEKVQRLSPQQAVELLGEIRNPQAAPSP